MSIDIESTALSIISATSSIQRRLLRRVRCFFCPLFFVFSLSSAIHSIPYACLYFPFLLVQFISCHLVIALFFFSGFPMSFPMTFNYIMIQRAAGLVTGAQTGIIVKGIYAQVCECVCECVYVRECVCMCVCVWMCLRVFVCVCACANSCVPMFVFVFNCI